MKKCNRAYGWLLATAILLCGTHVDAHAQTARDLSGRIVFSTDGNVLGKNDISSTPLALALLDKAGQTNKIVYVDYANRYWNGFPPGIQRL